MSEFSVFIQYPEHRFAVDYYEYYGCDGPRQIRQPVHQINNLLGLLEQIAVTGERLILIVSHGNPEGLTLRLTGRRSGRADSGALAILLKMDIVNQTIDDLNSRGEADDPEKWFELLNRTLRSPGDNRHPIVALLNPPSGDISIVRELRSRMNQSNSEEIITQARGLLDQWHSAQLRQLNISEGQATSLLNAMRAVQALHLRRVIIRGCNIGQSEESTQALNYFFGASILDAPTVYTVFGFPSLNMRQSRLRQAVRGHRNDVCNADELRRREGCWWWFQNYQLSARIRHRGSINYRMDIITDSEQTLATWKSRNFGGPTAVRSGRFPVHFLLTAPPLFPLNHDWDDYNTRTMS